jgi:ABC-type multidrug transport system permease subunit
MHLRMIRTIFTKDLLDAIRDARVLVAIVVPLGLGLFYGQILDDDPISTSAEVAVYAAGPTDLPAALEAVAGETVELRFETAADGAAVERAVAEEDVDLGLLVPAGFDAALRRGERPTVRVVEPESTTLGGDYVAAALEPALRQLAGQAEPARIETSTRAPDEDTRPVIERIGFREYSLLATVVFLVVMIAMLAVPVILAEEAEKKTLDALVLIASHADVVAAKALVGLAYAAVAVGLQMALTRLAPADPIAFAAALALLAVALTGFGLLLGGLFKNANQLNTWSGFLLLPVITPVFLVGLPMPATVDTVLLVLPTSQATRLALNGLSGEALFPDAWLSVLVVAAWGLAAYLLLLRQLRRREA